MINLETMSPRTCALTCVTILIGFSCTGENGTTGPRAEVVRTAILGGADQVRFPGTPLASPVRVIGLDADGNEVRQPGLPVTWVVLSGGGSTVPESQATTANGSAAARWVLGPASGTQGLEVAIAGSTPARVTARAVAPGEIVFSSMMESAPGFGGADLVVISPDGSDRVPLAAGLSNAMGPRWSPDGSAVVYSRDVGSGNSQVFLTEMASLDETQLTDMPAPDNRGIAVLDPAWSPDGSRIAFIVKRGETGPGCDRAAMNLWVMDRDGGNHRQLTSGCGLGQRQPDWSPAGDRIVFHQNREFAGTQSEIMIVNVDGTDLRNLTPESGTDDIRPRWSPDGSRILFTRGRSVWTMNPDGSGQKLLWDPPSSGPVASNGWAPDGSQILVTIFDANGGDLFRYDLVSGSPTRITGAEGNDTDGDWRR